MVDRRSARELTFVEFYEHYMLANKPVIITDAMDSESWPAVRDWVTTEGTPNTQFLRQKFGQCDITAHNCKRVVMGGLRTHNMTMAEFLDWWEETHMESEKKNPQKEKIRI
jgi:hypothetical protein